MNTSKPTLFFTDYYKGKKKGANSSNGDLKIAEAKYFLKKLNGCLKWKFEVNIFSWNCSFMQEFSPETMNR